MANRKATMTDIRVIIREFVRGTSLREMERKLKISRTSLRAYRDRAEASGKSMVELLSLEDAELNAILVKGNGHNLQKVMKSIFFRGMLAHYLRKLFLCKSNHKSVFLKLNMFVLFRHFKFTDFFLSTYADTLLGTLSHYRLNVLPQTHKLGRYHRRKPLLDLHRDSNMGLRCSFYICF